MSACPDCRYNPCQCNTIATLRAEVERLTDVNQRQQRQIEDLIQDHEDLRLKSSARIAALEAELAELQASPTTIGYAPEDVDLKIAQATEAALRWAYPTDAIESLDEFIQRGRAALLPPQEPR